MGGIILPATFWPLRPASLATSPLRGEDDYDRPMELAQRHCVPCEKGTPPLAADRVEALAKDVPGWKVEHVGGHQQLARTVKFKGFMPGVELLQRIADIAEAEGHHPDLCLAYGSLSVTLWTHAAGGLTDNDFILAARIDRVI
jgi:4a-hydroxytetrahydrobiopterin dehydratase